MVTSCIVIESVLWARLNPFVATTRNHMGFFYNMNFIIKVDFEN